MFKLLAGVIVGMGALLHGVFGGGGHDGSSTEDGDRNRDHGPHQFMGSSTEPRMHNGSTTESRMEDSASTSDAQHLRMERIFGTVSAVNGNILSVSVERRATSSDATTTIIFSVDASAARIFKGSAPNTSGEFMGTTTATIADIVVGDKVGVQGEINGASITARFIVDGVVPTMRASQRGRDNRTGNMSGRHGRFERSNPRTGSTTHDR